MNTMQLEARKTLRGIMPTPAGRPALLHRHFNAAFLGERNRFGISSIHVSHHAHPGIIRQHAFNALGHFFRSILHRHLSLMTEMANPIARDLTTDPSLASTR